MTLLILTLTLIGGVVSLGTIVVWFLKQKKKLSSRISWKKVEKGIIVLREKLLRDNYTPTLIICIGRGGSIVGALLSGTLGNIPILTIDRVYKWSSNQRSEDLYESIKINKNLSNVLLVSGELHSGNTVRKYKEYFKKIGAEHIKILTFMKELFPTTSPDYFYIESNNPKMKFPWMLTKDYKRDSKLYYRRTSK